ncbi:ferritin-like domain-containing protein [Desulfurivibrio dismutans]|uniref:ferritin-like domain-containing protein n=1 Tax=Desulfurivibrio dismutans TaxID=1398908 RepID=UPI0023DB91A7|nr:ferritin family protein [Desulfurivibrio alkaliphilus]MDF1615098.1 ferritin family protein [Desulfurivibrio alkaliphilus]
MELERCRQAIESAIQSEIDARKFYEQVGERIKDSYLKEVFAEFAQEEAKHEKILTEILEQKKVNVAHFDFQTDFHVSETIKMPKVSAEMDLKSAIGLAMKNEEIAMKKYTSLAENCIDPELKSVFMSLAAMERSHKHIMEEKFVDVAYPEVW